LLRVLPEPERELLLAPVVGSGEAKEFCVVTRVVVVELVDDGDDVSVGSGCCGV